MDERGGANGHVSPIGHRCVFGAVVALVLRVAPLAAHALTLELSGQVTLRPQGATRALSTTRKTVLLADDSLQATARVVLANAAERKAFPRLVLQRQNAETKAWLDIYTFYQDPPPAAKADKPEKPIPVAPAVPKRLPEDVIPPKTAPPSAGLVPTTPPLSYNAPSFSLPAETSALRARAVRDDGTSVESPPLRLEVRRAPAVLTLLAMGGACAPPPHPDANTSHKTLTEAGITRSADVCARRGAQATYLGDLTPMASVNCNNPCNANCMNFLEHLALRIMNGQGLATRFDSIDNPGQRFCHPRTNPNGVRNHVVFGKWRNTEEEPVCSTPIKFNTIIDNFVKDGGQSLILVGQSQGGAKFAGMVRDHWRWSDKLTLELLVLWDATSFDVPKNFPGHPGIVSMGVERVGSRPRHTVSFYQYSDLIPFQNGAPLRDPAEQYDLDRCFSHNAIARSQFVHHKTSEAVKRALEALRDRARS